MRTIYVDENFKCHVSDDGTMTAVETDVFDSKCDAFVEGHCINLSDCVTTVYPWKPYNELTAAQAQYERDLAEAAAAYQEGVDSV